MALVHLPGQGRITARSDQLRPASCEQLLSSSWRRTVGRRQVECALFQDIGDCDPDPHLT